jgi:hypothetical protein
MNKKVDSYINSVMKEIYLKKRFKKKIKLDLYSHIMEAAEDNEINQILENMGHPHTLAKEMMENYSDNFEAMGTLNAVLYGSKVRNFEIKSDKMVGSYPLIHVAMGYDQETGRRKVAKGAIAIGDLSIGLLSFGALSAGLFSFGAFSLGILSIGAVTFSLLFSIGAVAISLLVAIGAVAIGGLFAIGAAALSLFNAIGEETFVLFSESTSSNGTLTTIKFSLIFLLVTLPLLLYNFLKSHFNKTIE